MVLTITALLLNPNEFEQAMEEPPEHPPLSMKSTLDLVLKEIIVTRRSAYKTTIAEDYGLLNDTTLQRRHRMAIEVRLGEKEILALAANAIEQQAPANGKESNEEENAGHVKRRKYD